MSTHRDREEPSSDISTWTLERLRAFAAVAQDQDLEAVRCVAQTRAGCSDQPREVRLEWAKLALQASWSRHVEGPWARARAAQHCFMLRTRMIDELGPDDDPDWSPQRLAADTVAELTLSPAAARALAEHWRDLPIERIGELRRHKNMTAHLDTLLDHLRPGPTRDHLHLWRETRRHLP
ncbi:hypothetical protein AB0M39_29510 [Streptomyces sp. NPDC051907]|uniref:hypothetical protein n=1 Tax=Streptomyces sp. NPDC051907 TaxID=3155284 RepID=UPI00341BC127